MKLAGLLVVAATSLQSAVVQGVVLDEETGNPLARTLVTLTPLPGTSGGAGTTTGPVTLRTGERGAFTIVSVRPGWYLLKAARRGFADTESGQLRPGRPGIPFEIAPDAQSSFFQIRMRRLAAVTGSVLDENSVGIPDWPVHVYTAKKPVRRIAEGKTDDRGNFRVGALDPGAYVVRSGAGYLEDNFGIVATYYKFGTALETAQTVRLRLGETQADVTIRPVPGRLLQLSGIFSSSEPAKLTMITDTGRRQVSSAGPASQPFEVTGVPPGAVEFVAEGFDCGGYTRLIADRDTTGIRIACGPVSRTSIGWSLKEGGRPPAGYPVMARRVDLDGTGPAHLLKPGVTLAPGHWEFMVEPSVSYYTTSIRALYGGESSGREDGWYGLYLGNQANLSITISNRPGSIAGVVTTGGKPVAGAAVYLELFNPDLIDKRLQLWGARTDSEGKYTFGGLAPGRYRVLSSFDFDIDDPFVMEKAADITLHEGSAVQKALEMLLP